MYSDHSNLNTDLKCSSHRQPSIEEKLIKLIILQLKSMHRGLHLIQISKHNTKHFKGSTPAHTQLDAFVNSSKAIIIWTQY